MALLQVFIDSPLSRFGCTIATVVAYAYGFLLSTGKVERYGKLIIMRGLPRFAFRRGGVCVGRVYLTNQNVRRRVLQHELMHVAQWERYGLLFPLLYTLAGVNPLKNRFEIEAGLEAGGYIRG